MHPAVANMSLTCSAGDAWKSGQQSEGSLGSSDQSITSCRGQRWVRTTIALQLCERSSAILGGLLEELRTTICVAYGLVCERTRGSFLSGQEFFNPSN